MKKLNKKCPVCKSKNIKLVDYIGVKCILCLDCGFDERKHYEVFPEEKVSQKEKGRYSPYKSGGGSRVSKF